MPHFFHQKPKTLSIDFSELANEPVSEAPFWEVQRGEALDIITTFFSSWQANWQGTKRALTDLKLTADELRQLEFYETDQKKAIVKLLAESLVAWEKDDSEAFRSAILSLAKELRPSLYHFEIEGDHNSILSPSSIRILQNFTRLEADSLKNAIIELQRLAWHKLEFGDKVISVHAAEALIEEKLGLSFFEFLDFSPEDPEFNAHGFFPALLQDSADFGL